MGTANNWEARMGRRTNITRAIDEGELPVSMRKAKVELSSIR
jgi:hypothetical protein